MTALELLAPARNADIGIAAIDCGADAVYIAGPSFGARAAAGNPVAQIRRLCDYAHRYGARVFVTINTIIYDDELDAAVSLADEVRLAGADAIIVQDLALAKLVRGIPVHASTQCSIRDASRASFLEGLGFSRLILERQMSLDQIREIRSGVRCDIEFFVHGALCVCYSGQCYLSQLLSSRSANRGSCIQACRALYDLVDSSGHKIVRQKALLSLKDYNLLSRLGELADAGVSSFKIEGRLKNESYVRNVVREYSEALDELILKYPQKYCRASFGRIQSGFEPSSDKTFNRGYTSLFIDGERGSWASLEAAKGMGPKVGLVSGLNHGKTEFFIGGSREKFSNGDGFSFIGKNGRIYGFRADIVSGMKVKCKSIPQLFEGAQLYRNYDSAFEKRLSLAKISRKIPVTVDLDISFDCAQERFVLRAVATSQDGRTVVRTVDGGQQKASNIERMLSIFYTQMTKESGIFTFEDCSIHVCDESLVPIMSASSINALRRELTQALEKLPCRMTPTGKPSKSCCRPEAPPEVDYRYNVANSVSENIYRECGASQVEKAFELTHRASGIELMRTRYCIRYKLGMCLKENPVVKGPLFLENNGYRLSLNFDCARCEMSVSQAQ